MALAVDVTRSERKRSWDGYLYILPGLVLFLAVVLVPIGHAIVLSFLHWNGLTTAEPIGLKNYLDAIQEERLREAFVHSAYFVFFFSFLPIAIGLLFTAVMTRARVVGLTAFRTVLFLPQVLPMVVIGLTWRWIYNPDGLLNTGLAWIGLESLQQPWLGSFTWALPAVGLVGTWKIYGLAMVLFLAGIQKIPIELYEAARIDGAGAVREFFAVTIPGLRRELLVALAITLLTALRVFDVVWVMTGGGPGSATTVPSFEIYRAAFQTREVGLASAIGLIMAAVAIAVFAGISLIQRRRRLAR